MKQIKNCKKSSILPTHWTDTVRICWCMDYEIHSVYSACIIIYTYVYAPQHNKKERKEEKKQINVKLLYTHIFPVLLWFCCSLALVLDFALFCFHIYVIFLVFKLLLAVCDVCEYIYFYAAAVVLLLLIRLRKNVFFYKCFRAGSTCLIHQSKWIVRRFIVSLHHALRWSFMEKKIILKTIHLRTT